MCTVCGCGKGGATLEDGAHDHSHEHAHEHAHEHIHLHEHAGGVVHEHAHSHAHEHAHDDDHGHGHDADRGGLLGAASGTAADLNFGGGIAGVHVPGLSQERIVQIERDILDKNRDFAARNRATLGEHGTFALNLVSSPGSGKTTLLVRTIEALRHRLAMAVIEGDQQTSNDAQRIRATGIAALQINTGKGCHLDAHMVGQALVRVPLASGGVIFIENVGNLVCPAAFDLGEAHKVVILSVTEGEDKPLKYPDMFRAAALMILGKIDLLPHVDFDSAACIAAARRVNPAIEVMELSARTGEGMDRWLAWVELGARDAAAGRAA